MPVEPPAPKPPTGDKSVKPKGKGTKKK